MADPGVTVIQVTPAGIAGAMLIPFVGQQRLVPLDRAAKVAGDGTDPDVEVNANE